MIAKLKNLKNTVYNFHPKVNQTSKQHYIPDRHHEVQHRLLSQYMKENSTISLNLFLVFQNRFHEQPIRRQNNVSTFLQLPPRLHALANLLHLRYIFMSAQRINSFILVKFSLAQLDLFPPFDHQDFLPQLN